MKKFFQMVGLVSLIGFSFFYTNKTATVVREMDPLLVEIRKISDSKKIDAIDAKIEGNTIIPGISGKEIDENKSYRNMKRVGNINEKLLEYKSIRPNITVSKNIDKYIISGNPVHKTVTLLFLVTEKEDVDSIVKILKEKNTPASFFVDGKWFEANNEKVMELIKQGFTVGNMSYQLDYQNSGFIWMNTILSRVGKQKMNFCYNIEDNQKALDICSLQKNYTIRPSIIIDKYPTIEVKQKAEAGSIIALPISSQVIKELPLIIDYISSKDLTLVSLPDHIRE